MSSYNYCRNDIDFGEKYPPTTSLIRSLNIVILYYEFLASSQRLRASLPLECAQDIQKLLDSEIYRVIFIQMTLQIMN